MKKCRIRRMTLREYKKWLRDPRSRGASLPAFFDAGTRRTANVLRGVASEKSAARWRSFRARHGKAYCSNPTYRRAVALRNWGFAVAIPREEKK